MNDGIKALIEANIDANKNIEALEAGIINYAICSDKDKADFGNLCIALKGYRMVAEATECILINANVLKGDDGEFYEKVTTNEESTENIAEQNTTKSE